MFRSIRPRLTYANVVSTLALALAVCGGTAYAATKIGPRQLRFHAVTGPKLDTNAVSGGKVRNGSLSGADLRDNSVTSADVRNGALLATDFAAGQLPQGPKGDPGTSTFGTISSGGTAVNGRGITAVTQAPAGVYTVSTGQDVSRCAVVATIGGAAGGPDAAGSVTAQVQAATGAGAQQIVFRTRPVSGGTPESLPFHFAVFC